MRFSEITEDSSQEGTLLTLMQYLLARSSLNTKKSPTLTFSTPAIIRMMNNTGAAISYPDLNALIQSSAKLKRLIKTVTQDQLIINDTSSQPPNLGTIGSSNSPDPGEQEVEKMARRASKG